MAHFRTHALSCFTRKTCDAVWDSYTMHLEIGWEKINREFLIARIRLLLEAQTWDIKKKAP